MGSPVDLKDTKGSWFQAQVRLRKSIKGIIGRYQIMLLMKMRQKLVHYVGWADNLDEWLPCTSARLAEFNSKSRGRHGHTDKASIDALMLCSAVYHATLKRMPSIVWYLIAIARSKTARHLLREDFLIYSHFLIKY